MILIKDLHEKPVNCLPVLDLYLNNFYLLMTQNGVVAMRRKLPYMFSCIGNTACLKLAFTGTLLLLFRHMTGFLHFLFSGVRTFCIAPIIDKTLPLVE